MFKDSEVIAALIAGITVLIAEVIKIAYSFFKDKKDKKKELNYFIDNDFEVEKKVWALLNTLTANRIYVARFHNGGSYDSGMDIRKFSITNEAFSDDIDDLIMPIFRERLLSEFTTLFRPLIYTGSVEIREQAGHPDKIIQKYLELIGGKSAFLYCIRAVSGKPIGFLGIHYADNIELSDEKKEYIINFSESLVPFLGKK